MLEAICKETTEGNPDTDFLKEAIEAIKKLQSVAQLYTFQAAMNKGPTSKMEWYNLVAEEVRKAMPKKETKRQSILFELIKGEMDYVKDLENIEVVRTNPLSSIYIDLSGKFRCTCNLCVRWTLPSSPETAWRSLSETYSTISRSCTCTTARC